MIRPLLYCLAVLTATNALCADNVKRCSVHNANKDEILATLTCSLLNAEFSVQAGLTYEDIVDIVENNLLKMEEEVRAKARTVENKAQQKGQAAHSDDFLDVRRAQKGPAFNDQGFSSLSNPPKEPATRWKQKPVKP